MKKILALILSIMMLVILAVPTLALTNHPSVINIPNAAATIDGKIEPGEWDEATQIYLKSQDALEDFEAGVPGAAYINPADGDPQNIAAVRLKVKDGFLYVLEEKTADAPIIFTDADEGGTMPWMTSGSIIFFVKKSENLNVNDLYITPTQTPRFGHRPDNDQAQTVAINAAEAATVISADSKSVTLEAKIALSDLRLTEADFTGGDMLLTYCSIYAFSPDFAPWEGGYQTQYIGVGPWDSSLPVALVAGAEWPPPAVVEPEPVADEPAAGGGEAADAEVAPVVQAATAAAPQTGDSTMIFVILGIALTGAVVISKRVSKSKV